MARLDKWEKEHIKHIAKYEEQVRQIYATAIVEATKIGQMATFDPSRPFSFADFPLTNKLMSDLQRRMTADLEAVITKGVDTEWALSETKTKELVESVYSEVESELMELRKRAYLEGRERAREAFKMRKEAGLSLSDRVWRYTGQFKEEIEMALDMGLLEGKSADELSREVRKYLNNPDMLFRRVRDKRGMLHLSQRAKAYHPGQGVYRSSYKNARRLTATETNMAYRSADYEHRQALDFVVGIKIQLSNNHTLNGEPFVDICDHLAGNYPKDFKFVGWHPLCRCFTTTILKTQAEIDEDTVRILQGKAPKPASSSKNYVGDTPDQFKAWCALNAGRVERAKSLPYFIRDNKGYYDAALNPKKAKELTPLEIAKYRHEQRTPVQIESIKNRWHKRQEKYRRTELAANNILKVAKDYGEVDYTLLQKYVDAHDLKGMASVTRSTAKDVLAMKQAEAKLATLIPDAHKWHKQYTIAELQQVYDAVEKKMATIKNLPLEQQLKKLEFEMQYVADPTKYKPGATKYPTWKVSQDAYSKQYGEVLEAIEWQNIKDALFEAQTFKTKSPQYKALLSDLEDAVLQKKKGTAQMTLAELQAKRHSLEMSMARRAAKRQGSTTFSEDAFTQERKNKAQWNITAKEADDYFHDNAVEFWKKLTDEEKEALWGYTAGSGYITEPLRAINGHYYWYESKMATTERHIRAMTTALNKQTLKEDVWIKRDSDPWNIDYIFGIDLNNYKNKPQALIGKTGLEASFQSCGSCRETRFTCTGPKQVIMNIYCPKGTNGAYAQPWSSCGTYGRRWNGIDKSGPNKNSENEVLLQRGAKMRITKAEYKNGMWYIDVDVIGFDIRDFNLVKGNGGYYCEFK